MGFEKFFWSDRLVEYPNRKKIVDDKTGNETIATIYRHEGNIGNEGTAFSSENMNNLENRISNIFPVKEEDLDISDFGELNLNLKNINGSSPVYLSEYANNCIYYRIGKICHITVNINCYIKENIGNTLILTDLPFNSNKGYIYSLAVSQLYANGVINGFCNIINNNDYSYISITDINMNYITLETNTKFCLSASGTYIIK